MSHISNLNDLFNIVKDSIKNVFADYFTNTHDITSLVLELKDNHILAYVKNKRQLNVYINVEVISDVVRILISAGAAFENKIRDIFLCCEKDNHKSLMINEFLDDLNAAIYLRCDNKEAPEYYYLCR